jgi:hypothetical protein
MPTGKVRELYCTEVTGMEAVMSGKGHEKQSPPPMLIVRYRSDKPTFVRARA